jgi:alkylhydroperoxidase family enzyme
LYCVVVAAAGRLHGQHEVVETRYDTLLLRLREASQAHRDQPEPARAYLETVGRHAFQVTDRDVEELRAAGLSEDEIFEATVATAVRAGLDRIEAGLRSLA